MEIGKMEMPENLIWMFSQEGRDKADADIKIVVELLKQAMAIVEKYGARLECKILRGDE